MRKLENAVFVKMDYQQDSSKTWLCHLGPIRPEELELFNFLNEERDLYGFPCIVQTAKGNRKGWIVSNILKMSPNKMRQLAKDVGGYYPLAKVVEVVCTLDYEKAKEKLKDLL